MREIKFRARRIDNGYWVFGQYFKTPLTDENSGTTPDAGWFFLSGEPRHCIAQDGVSFAIDAETLGQYTELKDKNGVEIYEGDIVCLTWRDVDRGIIRCEDGCFKVCDMDQFYDIPLFLKYPTVEVIGNIYENENLLRNTASECLTSRECDDVSASNQ